LRQTPYICVSGSEQQMSGTMMDLAVRLFERGFSEPQVQAAASCCQSYDEAVQWLLARQDVTVPQVSATRRRILRKREQANSALSVASGKVAATTSLEDNGAEGGNSLGSHAKPESDRVDMPICPSAAAKAWWEQAAVCWREVVDDLTARRGTVAVIGLSPNSRKRTLEVQENQDGKYVPAAMSDTKESGPAKRPPATPQLFAERPSNVAPPWDNQLVARCASPSPQTIAWNPCSAVCSICCNDCGPDETVQLGCKHGWYCLECMQRHAEARLELGDPCVACPECCQALPEKDLRRILPAGLVEKLLNRSLERAVNATADLWACPTPNCPMRVAVEEGMSHRLQCSMCKRTSCLRCGAQPYHKGMSCEAYAKRGTADAAKRQMVQDGTTSLLQWIKACGAKQCPTCRMPVTKQNLDCQSSQYKECHKMMCLNCNTRFCFKCTAILTDTYTCGCSIDAHGFVDPRNGKRVEHLRAKPKGGRPTKAVKTKH